MFWSYFGFGVEVAVKVWNGPVHLAILPDQEPILHLQWALYFMKCYPTEETAYTALGGHTGAVDPTTHQTSIWPFIVAITNLEPYFAIIFHCFDFHSVLFLLRTFWISLENRYNHDQYNGCFISIHGTDFQIHKRGQEWYFFKFKSGFRYEVSCQFQVGKFAWFVGPINQESTMTLIFFGHLLHHILTKLSG